MATTCKFADEWKVWCGEVCPLSLCVMYWRTSIAGASTGYWWREYPTFCAAYHLYVWRWLLAVWRLAGFGTGSIAAITIAASEIGCECMSECSCWLPSEKFPQFNFIILPSELSKDAHCAVKLVCAVVCEPPPPALSDSSINRAAALTNQPTSQRTNRLTLQRRGATISQCSIMATSPCYFNENWKALTKPWKFNV